MVAKSDGSGKNKNSSSLNEEDYFAKLNETVLKKIKTNKPEEKGDTRA